MKSAIRSVTKIVIRHVRKANLEIPMTNKVQWKLRKRPTFYMIFPAITKMAQQEEHTTKEKDDTYALSQKEQQATHFAANILTNLNTSAVEDPVSFSRCSHGFGMDVFAANNRLECSAQTDVGIVSTDAQLPSLKYYYDFHSTNPNKTHGHNSMLGAAAVRSHHVPAADLSVLSMNLSTSHATKRATQSTEKENVVHSRANISQSFLPGAGSSCPHCSQSQQSQVVSNDEARHTQMHKEYYKTQLSDRRIYFKRNALQFFVESLVKPQLDH